MIRTHALKRFLAAAGTAITLLTAAAASAAPDLYVQAWVNDSTPMTGSTIQITARIHNWGDSGSDATIALAKRMASGNLENAISIGSGPVPELNGLYAVEHQFRNIPEVVELTEHELTINVQAPGDENTWLYGICVTPVAGETNTADNCSGPIEITAEEPDIDPPAGRDILGAADIREAMELQRPPFAPPIGPPGPRPDPIGLSATDTRLKLPVRDLRSAPAVQAPAAKSPELAPVLQAPMNKAAALESAELTQGKNPVPDPAAAQLAPVAADPKRLADPRSRRSGARK